MALVTEAVIKKKKIRYKTLDTNSVHSYVGWGVEVSF